MMHRTAPRLPTDYDSSMRSLRDLSSTLESSTCPSFRDFHTFEISSRRESVRCRDLTKWSEGNERCKKRVFDRSFWSIEHLIEVALFGLSTPWHWNSTLCLFVTASASAGEAGESPRCSILMFRKRFVRKASSSLNMEEAVKSSQVLSLPLNTHLRIWLIS